MSERAASEPSVQIRKGLEGVVAAETRISKVDGKQCQLIYRGYDIGELVGRATTEEVSYLLMAGVLPTQGQLDAWRRQLEAAQNLEPAVMDLLRALPATADPMGLLRSTVSILGNFDTHAEEGSNEAMQGKVLRIIAKVPTIVAAIGRLRAGQEPVPPKPGLGRAANFLYMLHEEVPSDLQTRALDAYFILLADHGFNASTFAARIVTGTQSDYYSAIAAAIGTLKGPLHGAANRKAMESLLEIGEPDRVDAHVEQTLGAHKRFMGFGHRVYKGEDPRAKHLKRLAEELAEADGDTKWFAICERLQEAVWNAKQLAVNVDFYSAPLLHYLGIPTELFTAMFACARAVGWSAQILEQAADNRLIRPLASYVGPRDLRYTPIEQRTATISA